MSTHAVGNQENSKSIEWIVTKSIASQDKERIFIVRSDDTS
jgi:hypothetical protein